MPHAALAGLLKWEASEGGWRGKGEERERASAREDGTAALTFLRCALASLGGPALRALRRMLTLLCPARRQVLQRNDKIELILMSATLNPTAFKNYFTLGKTVRREPQVSGHPSLLPNRPPGTRTCVTT